MTFTDGPLNPQNMPVHELVGSEASIRAGVANSERRILMMGAIGVIDGVGARTAHDAYEDYVKPVPGIERFFGASNFRQAARELSDEYVNMGEIPTGVCLSEQELSLTERGYELAGLGGLLLDVSFRRNIPLRVMLGKTFRHGICKQPHEKGLSTQDRYIRLGSTLEKSAHPITVKEITEQPDSGENLSSLHKLLKPWLAHNIVNRNQVSKNSLVWEFTEEGRLAFLSIIESLQEYMEDKSGAVERGLGLLALYLTDPTKVRALPYMFRRDYIAAGTLHKGAAKKLCEALKYGLGDFEPGRLLTTTDIAGIVKQPVHPRALHKLEWILNGSSPLRFCGLDSSRHTLWVVA